MSGGDSMTAVVQRYLAERRAPGYDLTVSGAELMRFACYADAHSHRGPLTQELILGWAREHVKRTTEVTAAEWPDTIHDFGGFPDELYRLR